MVKVNVVWKDGHKQYTCYTYSVEKSGLYLFEQDDSAEEGVNLTNYINLNNVEEIEFDEVGEIH